VNRRVGLWRSARGDYINLWTEEEKQREEEMRERRDREEKRTAEKGKQEEYEAKLLSNSKVSGRPPSLVKDIHTSHMDRLGSSRRDVNTGQVAIAAASGSGDPDERSAKKDDEDFELQEPGLEGATRPKVRAALSAWRAFDKGSKSAKMGEDSNAESHMTLDVFKTFIGCRSDVWDEIFQRPEVVQKALAVPPGSRSETDKAELEKLLRIIPVFRDVGEEVLDQLCEHVEYRTVKAKTNVFVQGEEAAALCVLMSGSVTVFIQSFEGSKVELTTLNPPDEFGQFNLILPESADRSSLETYQADTPSELLVITKEVFDRLLKKRFYDEWKQRYGVLKASGVFDGWSVEKISHVARLSRKLCFGRGDTLVQQGEPSDHLMFIVKGVCRVMKYPDVQAQIERKIAECDKTLNRIMSKYCFHHLLLETATKPADPKFMTLAEQKRAELEYTRAGLVMQLDHIKRQNRITHKQPGRILDGDTSKALEVGMLMPPGICGEMGVLDPAKDQALGSVVADTMVETLALHRIAFQTFDVTPDLIERIRRKGRIIYPDDEDIMRRLKLQVTAIAPATTTTTTALFTRLDSPAAGGGEGDRQGHSRRLASQQDQQRP